MGAMLTISGWQATPLLFVMNDYVTSSADLGGRDFPFMMAQLAGEEHLAKLMTRRARIVDVVGKGYRLLLETSRFWFQKLAYELSSRLVDPTLVLFLGRFPETFLTLLESGGPLHCDWSLVTKKPSSKARDKSFKLVITHLDDRVTELSCVCASHPTVLKAGDNLARLKDSLEKTFRKDYECEIMLNMREWKFTLGNARCRDCFLETTPVNKCISTFCHCCMKYGKAVSDNHFHATDARRHPAHPGRQCQYCSCDSSPKF